MFISFKKQFGVLKAFTEKNKLGAKFGYCQLDTTLLFGVKVFQKNN